MLASIGATAPFVGLFGTVWGIYHALVAIGFTGDLGRKDKPIIRDPDPIGPVDYLVLEELLSQGTERVSWGRRRLDEGRLGSENTDETIKVPEHRRRVQLEIMASNPRRHGLLHYLIKDIIIYNRPGPPTFASVEPRGSDG